MKKIILILTIAFLASVIFAGCNGATTSTKVQVGLEMNNLKYCTEIRGDRDYVEKADKTFAPGQTFYVYFEVSGFNTREENGKIVYHPIVNVEVTGPNDEVVISETRVVDQELKASHKVEYLYFPINVTLPSDAKDGKYTLFIKVGDAFGSGHITSKTQFFIKK